MGSYAQRVISPLYPHRHIDQRPPPPPPAHEWGRMLGVYSTSETLGRQRHRVRRSCTVADELVQYASCTIFRNSVFSRQNRRCCRERTLQRWVGRLPVIRRWRLQTRLSVYRFYTTDDNTGGRGDFTGNTFQKYSFRKPNRKSGETNVFFFSPLHFRVANVVCLFLIESTRVIA